MTGFGVDGVKLRGNCCYNKQVAANFDVKIDFVDVLTISRRLGHSSASITLDVYGHLIEGADADAANAIEGC